MARRILSLTAGALFFAGSLLGAQLVPAAADEAGVIEITEDQTLVVEYDGMGPGAGTENDTATPDFCELSPACRLVKLKVVLPADYDAATNDFAIQVRLDWETGQLPNDQGQENDLDLFLWDQPAGDEPVARSVGTRVPEIVGLSKAEKGTYNVTVRNSLGINRGFTLTVKWINGRLIAPTESVEPGRTEGLFGIEEEEPAPEDEQAFAEPAEQSAIRFGTTTPQFFDPPPVLPSPTSSDDGLGLGLVPIAPDADFDRIGGGTGIEGLLDAGEEKASINSILKQDAVRGPGKPPSGAVLGFWLGAVPVVLLLAFGFVLFRSRPLALSMTSVRASGPG